MGSYILAAGSILDFRIWTKSRSFGLDSVLVRQISVELDAILKTKY